MSITLTTDPIIDVADAKKVLSINDDFEAAIYINSVSQKFLQYTGRTVINEAAVTEYHRGNGRQIIYTNNAPISLFGDPTGTPPVAPAIPVTVTLLVGGETSDTLTDTDGELQVSAAGGEVVSLRGAFPESTGERNVKIEYTGGFATIPGDVILGAVMQMKVDRERMEKRAGNTSMSERGESASLDIDGIVKPVRDLWAPYRRAL